MERGSINISLLMERKPGRRGSAGQSNEVTGPLDLLLNAVALIFCHLFNSQRSSSNGTASGLLLHDLKPSSYNGRKT